MLGSCGAAVDSDEDADVVCAIDDCIGAGTEYVQFAGERLNGDQLWALFDSLDRNDLLHYTHVLTGVHLHCARPLTLVLLLLHSQWHNLHTIAH